MWDLEYSYSVDVVFDNLYYSIAMAYFDDIIISSETVAEEMNNFYILFVTQYPIQLFSEHRDESRSNLSVTKSTNIDNAVITND
ncbi:hypothetical protein V1478_005186 [Vespula squamosa]|uniref:Uncharacterized protein n=1 Tax=Vespula squamosa TaxID=30214 RepID=A0ABD2BE57_VESSQ